MIIADIFDNGYIMTRCTKVHVGRLSAVSVTKLPDSSVYTNKIRHEKLGGVDFPVPNAYRAEEGFLSVAGDPAACTV